MFSVASISLFSSCASAVAICLTCLTLVVTSHRRSAASLRSSSRSACSEIWTTEKSGRRTTQPPSCDVVMSKLHAFQ